jgi:hypothetical protein
VKKATAFAFGTILVKYYYTKSKMGTDLEIKRGNVIHDTFLPQFDALINMLD